MKTNKKERVVIYLVGIKNSNYGLFHNNRTKAMNTTGSKS